MTTNRPAPEGSWDHDLPHNMEDTASASTDADFTKPTPLLAMGLLHHTKENLEMLKGWKTIAVAIGIGVVGALQASGLTDVIPPAYVGPVMMGLGFAMAWLRTQSDTTVFTNTSPAHSPSPVTTKSSGTF
jgi:hypothetical protein